ncbi:hypothetical protein EHQ92_13820 [Leptospira biflexa]|nr:hypothetical protein [Leptospira biflexa]ABZ94802.1 Hypothetical protein LBF_2312 [Leptospira biflexa serovar Patoc strain 'Patoc 1 (Ames)']TGM31087.1 hypothetical protein EHQ89_17845 [Leptospira biflexa]TGM34575.1 hypothetical protein EHQ80_14770 [Leptospira biflexa]TGM44030.1 hypothetical protein EHQ92_13820 [Leptospira biflexa]TGM45008.1 hypothetical protein EHQ88_15920 [Leptospira biflexa]
MKPKFLAEEFLLALYFFVFSILSGIVFFYSPLEAGVKIVSLTAFFHVSFVAICIFFHWHTPYRIWKFLVPLSVFMVFPDWFLSAVLQTLVFPEDGFLKIGTVAGYMAGLWVIPLFICVYTGIKLEERSVSIIGTGIWVGLVSLIIFGTSEATMWILGSWYAQNVKMWGHVAYYVLLPEMILGITAYLAYQGFSYSAYVFQIAIGFLVMILYIGNLSFFYLLIEKIL